MVKRIIAGVVIAGALCAVLIPRFTRKPQFAQAVSLPVVEVETPVTGDIRLTTAVIGTVEPSDVVYIYPKAGGDVTAVNVKAGEVVKAGDVICTIDTKQVTNAKNSLDSATVSRRQANEELQRQKVLYDGGGLSEQAYAQYKNQAENAEIQYRQAKYNYETQLSYSEITAPIEGLVEICDVEVFDTVSPQNRICVLSGRGSRVISFNVTERISGYITEGDSIEIEKDGKTYSASVFEVSTMADESTGLFKVKAGAETSAVLPTGSRVKLTITSGKADDVLTIPVDAVYYEDSEPYVYTYAEGKLRRTGITAGLYDAERMEVKSGLTKDDQVVKTWSSELYDGVSVRLPGEPGAGGAGGAGGQNGPGGQGRPGGAGGTGGQGGPGGAGGAGGQNGSGGQGGKQ